MLTHRGYRYRIYPSRAQRTYFASAFGCCRYVYNACLQYKSEIYAAEHRTAGDAECMRLVTALKQQDGTAWLAGCDSMALQEAVKDLGRAQKAFFEKRAGFPKFRRKSDGFQSFRTRNQGNGVRITDKNHVRIPVAGILKAKVSRLPSGRILNETWPRCRMLVAGPGSTSGSSRSARTAADGSSIIPGPSPGTRRSLSARCGSSPV